MEISCWWILAVTSLFFGCVRKESKTFANDQAENSQTWAVVSSRVLVNSGSIDEILQENESRAACKQYFNSYESYKLSHYLEFRQTQSLVKSEEEKKKLLFEFQKKFIESQLKSVVLLCGKSLFLFESPSKQPIPERYLDAAQTAFSEIGVGFQNAGLLPVQSDSGYPIGIARNEQSLPIIGNTRRVTCGMCHVGKVGDNLFSIGMTNENIHYGRLFKVLTLPIYLLDTEKNNLEVWPEGLQETYRSMAAKMKAEGFVFPPVEALAGKGFDHFIFQLAGLARFSPQEAQQLLSDN